MDYFVKIDAPREIRLGLMRSLKEVLLTLSQYEDFIDIRSEKIRVIASLNSDFEALNNMSKKLAGLVYDETIKKELLEESKTKGKTYQQKIKQLKSKKETEEEARENAAEEIRPIIEERFEVPVRQQQAIITKKQDIKISSDVDRLEYTLSQIEKKIADLSK